MRIEKANPAGWRIITEDEIYYVGQFGQFGCNLNEGVVYKDEVAFNTGEGVCYIGEYGFDNANENACELFEFSAKERIASDLEGNSYIATSGYTKQDLVDLCDGNEQLAQELFDDLDWQMPESLLDDWGLEEE